MIISASRRTDIPAFYSQWFMNRIRTGCCTVVNPYNRKQVAYVSLRPEDVEVIVFWTKNLLPLIPHLQELDDKELLLCWYCGRRTEKSATALCRFSFHNWPL